MASHLSLEFVRDYIEGLGYFLLEDEYLGSSDKMILHCPHGHIFPMSWKMFYRGHRCSYCAGKRQYNISEVRGFFEEDGYTLLTEEYTGNKQHLDVVGPDGCKYQTTLFGFKVDKVRPHLKGLNSLKGEDEVRNIFEDITGKPFKKARPEWLVNPATGRPLELDGYNSELGLAFEFDGRYHFTEDDQRVRDGVKRDVCRKKGVRLLSIPHFVRNRRRFIENEIFRPGNFIYLGDPHVQAFNIVESGDLVSFVEKQMIFTGSNNLVILGDLFHNHAMVRLDVLYFWTRAIRMLGRKFRIHILVGNHDMALGGGEGDDCNAMVAFRGDPNYLVNIADAPYIYGGLGFLSYSSDPGEFLDKAAALKRAGAGVLVCHQTFQGAQYDNGFYAKDGIDPEAVPFEKIISGHIHTAHRFGKVIYPGNARWLTLSDANVPKGLWFVEHDPVSGAILREEVLSTEGVCRPIYRVSVNPGTADSEGLAAFRMPDPGDDVRVIVDIEGPSAFCDGVLAGLPQGDARFEVRVRREDAVRSDVRESEGIAASLRKFIAAGEYGVAQEELWKEVVKRTGISPA